ncbi:MAG: hypothetical protein IIB31_07580 [Chloroflexi bacterium]|nr:hypothetical protein [Chloroflexota bacterium]
MANARATSIKGTESGAAGLRAVVPLRSSKRKGAVITLGGFGEVWREPFSTNQQAFLDTLEIRKNDYRRNALAGMPLALLERWTGYDMLKVFGELDHKHLDKLIPGGEFPTHSFRAPATTFVDTFVDTNGTNLEDHTPTGSPAASGWTEIVGGAGSIDIVTGDIAQTTALDVDIQYMIDDNLASDDHYAEVVIDATETGSGGAIGTTVRKASGATETFNGLQFRTTAARIRLFRVNGGSPTALITDNSPTMTNGSLARVEIDGNDLLSCYDDGVLDASVTDGSPLTGNFLTGLWGSKGTTGTVNWDNFKASDLAAGGFAHSQAVIVG